MQFGITAKIAVVSTILLVAGVALIAPAYSYSSIVTTNGNITYEYITVNIYDGDDPATGMEFLPVQASEWSADNVTTTGFDLTPKDKNYIVEAKSNKSQTPGAYLYGYFTGGGAGINTITVTLTIGNTPTELILHRDAPVNQISLTDGITDAEPVNTWSMSLTKYEVSTFGGLQLDENNKVPVKEGSSAISAQALSDLFSVNGLTFKFFASWDSLTA